MMKRNGKRLTVMALALTAAAAVSLVSFGKENRTKIGTIGLTFSSGIQAGQSGGSVDVELNAAGCSIDDVEVVNEGDCWLGGDRPKVEVSLSADSGYYFSKSGKSAFAFGGDKAAYVSGPIREDKSQMVLTVMLDKLKADDEDLAVGGLSWDQVNGIATWNSMNIAKTYRVRLYRQSGASTDDGIGPVYTVNENSFDFSDKFPKAGSYYFKVKAVDARNNGGDWEESSYMEVTDQDLVRLSGQWKGDDRGWWFVNPDGSGTKNNWQYIHGKWYFFDGEGYMKTGWISWKDKLYYCDSSGAMLADTVTPDGCLVGADGARLN